MAIQIKMSNGENVVIFDNKKFILVDCKCQYEMQTESTEILRGGDVEIEEGTSLDYVSLDELINDYDDQDIENALSYLHHTPDPIFNENSLLCPSLFEGSSELREEFLAYFCQTLL